jgi:hypothetical protein
MVRPVFRCPLRRPYTDRIWARIVWPGCFSLLSEICSFPLHFHLMSLSNAGDCTTINKLFHALAYPRGGGANAQISNALQKVAQWIFEEAKVCPMGFSSIRTFNVRVLESSSRTSWSTQLNFSQPIARAFSPSAISTSHQFACIFDYISRSKYCIQTHLSDAYSRCLLSDFLVHQLCMITDSKNVEYE